MSDELATRARRLLALTAQQEEMQAAIDDEKAAILALTSVGDRIEVDGQPAFRIQQRRTFDLETAKRVVPAQLIQAATVPTVDAKALKSLLPPAVLDKCMVDGRVSVVKA